MGNPLLSKKAFFYFGGAFILLLGGAIVLMAPYHYTGFVALPGDAAPFDIWDRPGFYPQLEVSVTTNPEQGNNTVYVDLRIVNNNTLETEILNLTLTVADRPSPTASYEKRLTLDLAPGPYTVYVDTIVGAADIDLALSQASERRTYIITGGVMNIIGLVMGGIGYCIGGSVIPTGDEAIVDWGYDQYQKPQ